MLHAYINTLYTLKLNTVANIKSNFMVSTLIHHAYIPHLCLKYKGEHDLLSVLCVQTYDNSALTSPVSQTLSEHH